MRYHLLRIGIVLGALLLPLWANSMIASACTGGQQTCSSGYGVSEAFFGTGGQLCDPNDLADSAHSATYCAKTAAGETGVGSTASGNAYQAQAGFNTNRDPSLTVVVNDSQCADFGSASKSLGVLSAASASFTSVNFSVKSYLAGGYTVQTVGQAPTYTSGSSHTLATMSGGTSTPGTEQFGINLVANTTPAVGNNVQQLPDTTFGFGQAVSGYNTANHFRYNDGDQIASSAKSSGTTCYDISYLFNISNTTPAGMYAFNQSIVATSTF